jgi:hypothetical protein
MDEDHERKFPIAKEDIGPIIIGLICLALTLYLMFGPSPVKMLFHDHPAAAENSQATEQKPGQGMMPASAEPEESEQPEQAEKPKK